MDDIRSAGRAADRAQVDLRKHRRRVTLAKPVRSRGAGTSPPVAAEPVPTPVVSGSSVRAEADSAPEPTELDRAESPSSEPVRSDRSESLSPATEFDVEGAASTATGPSAELAGIAEPASIRAGTGEAPAPPPMTVAAEPGLVFDPGTPTRRRPPIGLLAGAVTAVAVLVFGATALFADDSDETAPARQVASDSDHPSSGSCGGTQRVDLVSARSASGGLAVTADVCPGGAAATTGSRVSLVDGSDIVASAVFDLAGAESERTVLQFPAGTYWRAIETLPVRGLRATVSAAAAGEAVSRSGITSGRGGVLTPIGTGLPAGFDAEAAAVRGLQAIADSDRSVATGQLQERWIPQVSSKRYGLVAEGVTWGHAEILREHLDLRSRFPGARLLWSGQWSTFSYQDFWITVIGTAFPTADGAVGWCRSNGFDRDHCYAKLLSTTHPVQGSTEYP